MRGCLRLLAAALFGLCLAGPAGADLLRWEGTLTLEFVHPGIPSMPFAGGGVATVNASAGLGQLSALRLAGGITGSAGIVYLTDPGVANLWGLRPSVALGTGVLGPISGGTGASLSQNTLALGGMLKGCVVYGGCDSFIPMPFTAGGTRGAGIGGMITVNGYGQPGIHISVSGAPWTIATAVAFNGTTANGGPTATAVRSGFAHGPASGTTTTAQTGGVVQLVTPILTETTLGTGQRLGLFGVLRINFVPEPGTALLVGAGCAGLSLVGRRRRRGP